VENAWYWYCHDTQVSQWEKPGDDLHDDYSVGTDDNNDSMTDYSTDRDDDGNYTDSEYGDNSSGWQEFWDEQAQGKYWYNYATGEATWTRPEELDDQSSSLQSTLTSISSKDKGNAGNNSVGVMGADWASYVDADSGQEYWFNSHTGETSWQN
jgi:hypothetical protein